MKTSELTGAQLDWAVAKSKGVAVEIRRHSSHPMLLIFERGDEYGPSYNWSQGGPIIDRKGITVGPYHDKGERVPNSWQAYAGWDHEEMESKFEQDGPTALIAAMRCLVASELGDEVEIPKELM